MRKWLGIALAGLVALAWTASAQAETKYAVCVGLNTYSLSGAGDLTGCVNDASYFYTNLVERGGWSTANITKLLNGSAKKTAIRKAISNYAAKAVSGDTFVYQHSSHGGQNSGRSVFLCAYDDYYEDTEVAADLRSFASGVKVIVVVDACHSGGLFMGDSGKARRAAAEFDLAGRVTELMDADRARRAARGEPVEKSLSAKEIGWVTAANYTESSLDGGFYESAEWLTNPEYGDEDYDEDSGTYPDSYKLGGVFLGSFTWSWWNGTCDTNGYGDGDDYADAYECWKDAYDFCTKLDKFWDVSGYSFTPQCTNVAVLRSVELGWAGKEEPSGFRFAKLADLDATVGSPAACTLAATNTDGSAASVTYAVSSATADASTYSLDGDLFTFTPAADGVFAFAFTATDALTGNTAKGTLTVAAALAAPGGLANSGVTATSFTANWGAVPGAASYLLDVASAPFGAKGAARADSDVLLSEDFAGLSGTAADRSDKLDEYLSGTGWTGSKVFENGGSAKLGSGSYNGWIATPGLDLSSGGAVSFDLTQYGKGDGNTVSVSILSGGGETEIGTATPDETATVEFAIPPASEETSVKIATSAKRAIIDNLVVSGGSSADILPAQEVAGTSFTVEGLATATYHWRVRAVGNAKGAFSDAMEVTLVADPTAPPSIRPIANIEIEVGETASAEVRVTTPEEAPLLSLKITSGDAAATLEEGVFSFAPAAPGTYEFTITAANANGSASISFTVTATLAEPETPEVPHEVGFDAFTAEWMAVPGAESYELVVIEGTGGSSGGGGGSGETLTETFAQASFSTAGGSYANQTISGGDLGTWTATQCRGDQGGVPTVGGTGTLTSPEIAGGVSAVEFDYSWPFAETATGDIDLYVGGSKVSSASVTGGTAGTAVYSFSPVSGVTSIEFANAHATAKKLRISFNEIRITTASGKSIARAVGDVVYSNNVGNVTSFDVTGLQPNTEYTFSFRAIAGGEATDWSEPVSVTTTDGPSAPAWSAIPAQNTYAGATFQLDLSAYLSGSPTPAVTADVGTVIGLHYVYEPESTGSVTVTLTASNDSGTDRTTFVLSIAEPPVGGNHYAVVVGCNKYDTEYIDSYNWLNGCVPDANHVQELITSRGEWEAANVTKLTDSSAKHSAVLSAIAAAASKALPGDTFLYFHSSHGGNYTYTFVTNTALYSDWPIMVYSVDPEGTDNCICTYDADFTAAELASALAAFDPAVNVVVMIDACHSAGMFQYTGTPVSQRVVRRNAAGKAMRSADASLFAEAVSAQIGAIRRARGIRAASNVAFVTAANFDEYSYDASTGDGGEFTTAFIEGVTNGVCDGAEYGDQDGWATFYEGWNYAKDIATGMPVGTEVDYEGHKVDANGYALYDNSDYTGAPYYEPAYYYDYYFTHAQIDNEPLLRAVRVGYAGNPTLAAPVAAPASGVTASSFTASWSAVADATGYRLQVATDESFSTGSSSDKLVAGDLAATSTSYAEFSGVAKSSGAVYAGKTAKSNTDAIQLNDKATTGAGIWTTVSGGNVSRIAVEWNSATAANRSLQIYGSDTALTSYAAVKAATLAGTIAYGSSSAVDLEGSYPYVGIVATGGALYLDSVTIDWGTAGSESTIVFDQEVGNVASFEVAGLEPETDYWYRVQALGDPVDSDFSNVIALTTEGGTPSAPVWGEIPPQTAVAGEDLVVDLKPYVTGSPKPTITADAGTVENGVLTVSYAAPGDYKINLTAANSEGSDTATLDVSVTAGPVYVPTLALSNPTSEGFDASWDACTGVSRYTLQIATDDQFTTGGSGGEVELFANPATTVTAPEGWTYDIANTSGKYLQLTKAENSVVSPAVSTKGLSSLTVSFEVRTYGGVSGDSGTALVECSTDGSTWTEVGTAVAAANSMSKKTIDAASAIGQDSVQFRWTAPYADAGKGIGIQNLVLAGEGTAGDGSLVKELPVEGTSTTVTGLDPETLYYARVKGESDWSEVQSIRTASDVPAAPAWLDLPAQTATAGLEFGIDLSSYVTGSPFPAITVEGEPTDGGAWVRTFDEAGTYTFALLAKNTEGTATATLTVVVSPAPSAKYAVCVGLSEYDMAAFEALGLEVTPLKGCVNDATRLKKNLSERGGWAEADIALLTNGDATKAAIRGAIAAAAAKAKAGDTFVYEHSSHGLQGDELDDYTAALAAYENLYTDTELAEDLGAFADGVKVIVLIDACHSAGMIDDDDDDGDGGAGSASKARPAAAFDIARRVSALIDANRAVRKARGEDVSRTLTSDQIGWVTAAAYDETSKDGGYYDTDAWMSDDDAEGEERGGLFLASIAWGWWSGKADVTGEGDGDGWFDAYEGWSFSTPYCAELDQTPQYLHEDVLRSVELGWVGDAAPSEAILFDPVPGVSVGIGEEAVLDGIVARNPDGTTDGITLSIVDPSPEEADYAFADGKLTFTPDEDGLFLFTVRAVKGRTSATKILGVTAVLPAPVAQEVADADIAEDGFTARWLGVDAARNYQLQVSTDPDFSMGEPDELVNEGFDDVTNKVASLPDDWTFSGTFGIYATGGEAPPSIKLSTDGATLTTPPFKLTSAENGLAFWTKGNPSGTDMTSTLTVQQLVGEEWQTLKDGTFVPSTDGETKEFESLDKAATRIRFVMAKTAGNIAIDDVVVAQSQGGVEVDEDEIPASETSYAVEDLEPGTTYYFRVRALANSRSAWSETIEVTTAGEKPIPVPDLTVMAPETTPPDTSLVAFWLCPGAEEFRLQAATDEEFANLVFDEQTTESVMIVTGLTPETTYYVRVCALDGARAGDWSEVKSLTTAAGGEPEEGPSMGGEGSDVEIASGGFTSKKLTATVSDDVAETYDDARLQYATEVVEGAWNWSDDNAIENTAAWPNLEFDLEPLGLNQAVFRLDFLDDDE